MTPNSSFAEIKHKDSRDMTTAEIKHTDSERLWHFSTRCRDTTNSGDVQMDYSGKRVRACHGSYRRIRAYPQIRRRKRSYRGAVTDTSSHCQCYKWSCECGCLRHVALPLLHNSNVIWYDAPAALYVRTGGGAMRRVLCFNRFAACFL
jgi:hypothetical protein